MFGNPGETRKTIRDTIEFSKRLKPDIVLFNITTPFPGTEMFEWAKAKGYIRTNDWRDYDLSQVVMDLPTIESEELVSAYRAAYREFYLRPSYILRRFFQIRSVSDIKSNYSAMRKILEF